MIGKSKDEIRAGMNPIERRILESQEGEARWRAYLKIREKLRQTPIEEAIEQAYEDNEKVDRLLARRAMFVKRLDELEAQGRLKEVDLFRLSCDRCFIQNDKYGLRDISYIVLAYARRSD
jgi:hypothetical protein